MQCQDYKQGRKKGWKKEGRKREMKKTEITNVKTKE